MRKGIGFIGGGNMGSAIMAGLVKAGIYQPQEIMVYDAYPAAMERLEQELHIVKAGSAEELAESAETVVLAVKPQVLPHVVSSLRKHITTEQLVVSIAAGITLDRLMELLSPEHRIVRVMPNTPAMVGEGMAGICTNEQVTEEEKAQVLKLFGCLGKAEIVPEKLMDAVVGVSGSGPAYVYMFIEAMADGAVREGMPRAQAYTFAAQTVLGSARMVLESGKHPGELKDMVCSPAGTTIEAVKALEDGGLRSIVMDAVHEAAWKNKTM